MLTVLSPLNACNNTISKPTLKVLATLVASKVVGEILITQDNETKYHNAWVKQKLTNYLSCMLEEVMC